LCLAVWIIAKYSIDAIRGLGQNPESGFLVPKIHQNSDSGKKPVYLSAESVFLRAFGDFGKE
jgi:hypothetical protein